jgi:hypothetical protein
MKGQFDDCRFCGGRGCAACDGERLRAENPPAPAPVPTPTPEEIDAMYENYEANKKNDELGRLRAARFPDSAS